MMTPKTSEKTTPPPSIPSLETLFNLGRLIGRLDAIYPVFGLKVKKKYFEKGGTVEYTRKDAEILLDCITRLEDELETESHNNQRRAKKLAPLRIKVQELRRPFELFLFP